MTADLSALDIERRLTAIEATLPTFATKADIHSLRADIQVMRSEWKTDLGEMKTDLHAREARLIKAHTGRDASERVRRRWHTVLTPPTMCLRAGGASRVLPADVTKRQRRLCLTWEQRGIPNGNNR